MGSTMTNALALIGRVLLVWLFLDSGYGKIGGFEGTAICCAYVASEPDLKPMRIRADLSRHVPAYMLPTQWMELGHLPKNQNGKTDRPRLRELFRERASSRVVTTSAPGCVRASAAPTRVGRRGTPAAVRSSPGRAAGLPPEVARR